jgi:hypothetical protein
MIALELHQQKGQITPNRRTEDVHGAKPELQIAAVRGAMTLRIFRAAEDAALAICRIAARPECRMRARDGSVNGTLMASTCSPCTSKPSIAPCRNQGVPHHEDKMENYRKTVEGYTQWVNEKIAEGYDPHLVTFMFHPMPGNQDARWLEMTRIINRVYGRVLSKTFRVPNAAKNQPFMPVLIMFPDFPIYKRDKDHIVDIVVNDGQHAQGMGLMPPNSRLEGNLSGHFLNHGEKYVRSYPGLQRIHSVRIE